MFLTPEIGTLASGLSGGILGAAGIVLKPEIGPSQRGGVCGRNSVVSVVSAVEALHAAGLFSGYRTFHVAPEPDPERS